MAGSASNWFKPTSGPLKGQAVYLSKAQRTFNGATGLASPTGDLVASRRAVMAALTNPFPLVGDSVANALRSAANSARPTGVAKTAAPKVSAPSGGSPTYRAASGPMDDNAVASAARRGRAKEKLNSLRRQLGKATPGDQMLGELYAAQGFHGKPHLADTATVDAMVAAGAKELFRGVRGRGAVTAKDMQDQLRSGDEHFPGFGIYGNGSYFASHGKIRNRDDALSTARSYSDGSSGSRVRAALDPRAKVGDYHALKAELSTKRLALTKQADALSDPAERAVYARYQPLIQRLVQEQRQYLTPTGKAPTGAKNKKALAYNALQDRINRLNRRRHREDMIAERSNGAGALRDQLLAMDDVGHYAVTQGYDAINVATEDYVVVLNRSALTIQHDDPR